MKTGQKGGGVQHAGENSSRITETVRGMESGKFSPTLSENLKVKL